MNKLTKEALQLLTLLQEQLTSESQQPFSVLRRTELALGHCQKAIGALRQCVNRYPFATSKEEISFFKIFKPRFMAEWLYYQELYQLYERSPLGDARLPPEQLGKALWRVQQFFEEHHDFYLYWRAGRSDRDECYFMRSKAPDSRWLPGIYYDPADSFSTGYDVVFAYMQAYERLEAYLVSKIECGQRGKLGPGSGSVPTLPWTGSKAALTEMLYGFECTGVVGHGKIPLKQMVKAFEAFFMIDLGNYSDTLSAFRDRKTGPALYIDEMKRALLDKLGEEK
ncbi:MAG TPA: RteC domain-containing protein [Chitinophagaceae bacterium]|jgi:hypothetical protein